jgi:hypothetical protein
VIASALVQKSYSANYPGEFGGGMINLTTKAVPTERFFQVGASVTYDTFTTGNLGYVYDGGRADWFGYDSGERKVPQAILNASRNRISVVQSADVTSLNNAQTSLVFGNPNIPANLSFDTSFGGAVDVGSVRLGLIAGGGLSNSWRTRDAIEQFATDNDGGLSRDFRTVTTDNRVIVNGLLGLGAEFGDHRIRFTNLYIHDTVKQAKLGAGGEGNLIGLIDGNPPLIDQSTAWFERQLFSSQVVGEFKFGDVGLDLRANYANTTRKSPYERDFRYVYVRSIFNTPVNDYVNDLGNESYARVAFSDLNEDLWGAQADFSYKANLSFPLSVSAGFYFNDTARTASRYQFKYTGPNNTGLPLVLGQLRPDYLLSDDTILNGCVRFIPGYTNAGHCIELRNEAASVGAAEYDAGLRILANYIQTDLEPITGVRINLGGRYEAAKETVSTTGLINTKLTNEYFLPAATVTWSFMPNWQLRIHGSKTIARPQFRELAPQLYSDYETNRQYLGNPLLQDSTLKNAEIRLEWFFAREQRITVAGFYKKIDNPIETIAFFPGGSDRPQVGFSNAPAAELYGAEVDVVKNFDLDFIGGGFFNTRRLRLAANYTYTQSKLKIGTEPVASPFQSGTTPIFVAANRLFVDGDPLVGQSDHIANFQIGIEDKDSLSQLTFLATYASDRVTNRGPVPVTGGAPEPNVIERPGWGFDVVARQGIKLFGAELELKLEGRNLTGRRHQEFQIFPNGVRRDIQTFDLGRMFSAGISVKI